jgi:threonine dehydrogenase-like Zn-dependent dehydrogenase
VPFGAAFGKGITMKMGQTNMHNYMKPLLERIEKGQIDPGYVISPSHHARAGPQSVQNMAGQKGKRY